MTLESHGPRSTSSVKRKVAELIAFARNFSVISAISLRWRLNKTGPVVVLTLAVLFPNSQQGVRRFLFHRTFAVVFLMVSPVRKLFPQKDLTRHARSPKMADGWSVERPASGAARSNGNFFRRRSVHLFGAGVIEDVELIDACLCGDSASFGQLVRKYQDRLFNTLCHVCKSREEAEDVAQEAFVQAFVKLATFQRNSAFYTWLYRIAFNTAISRGRRKRPELSVDAARDAVGDEPMDTSEDAAEGLLRRERAEQIHEALEELSEEHRVILVLREMEGLSYEEIADVLDLRVGTVRSRLHRARGQMREQLKEVLGEYQR